MRQTPVRVVIWIGPLIALCLGCSDEKDKVGTDAVFGGHDGGSQDAAPQTGFCHEYCQTLVDNAPGCEDYNDNGRCEAICNFYRASACQQSWEAFASCMQESPQAECTLPDGGKLALVISGCHTEFDTWATCRDEKDAGICPY